MREIVIVQNSRPAAKLVLVDSVSSEKRIGVAKGAFEVSLDGIETGVRQLVRETPLETMSVDFHEAQITVPTESELLRIKGALILKRNATLDYLYFVALADHMGDAAVVGALQSFDRFYQQENEESPLQQLQIQLSNALPYDLEETELSEYKNLSLRWRDWNAVKTACSRLSTILFDRACDMETKRSGECQA